MRKAWEPEERIGKPEWEELVVKVISLPMEVKINNKHVPFVINELQGWAVCGHRLELCYMS